MAHSLGHLGGYFLYLITSPLWLLLIAPGWIAWGLISIWFLYRIVLVGGNEQEPAGRAMRVN